MEPEERSTFRLRLGKHVSAARDTQATIEELLEIVFYSVLTGNKQKPCKIMEMQMFATLDNANPDTGNV
jgi:hypothetical protein